MAFKFSAKLSDSPQFVFEKPKTARWEGIELTVASEGIEKPTVWKIHENRHALIFHLGGKMNEIETEINRRASKLHPPIAGEFWLIPANSEYFTYTQGETVSYAEFYFDANYLEKYLGGKAKNYELTPRIGQFNSFLYQNAKELVSLISAPDDVSVLLGENISRTIALHLFGKYGTNDAYGKSQPKFTPKKFSLLSEYINDNLTEKITLEKLSEIAGMNSHNLLRFFGKSFGKTPAQYIIEQRLRKARRLLVNTKKDITTIAQETGFSSHSHFSTTFKTHIGITPNEFRAAH